MDESFCGLHPVLYYPICHVPVGAPERRSVGAACSGSTRQCRGQACASAGGMQRAPRASPASATPDSLYAKLLRLSKDEDDRFDVYDCASRVARCIVAFYWLLLRFPLSFCWFMVRYNLLWEGKTVSAVTFACFPIYPFAAFTMVLAKRLLGLDGGYVPAKG